MPKNLWAMVIIAMVIIITVVQKFYETKAIVEIIKLLWYNNKQVQISIKQKFVEPTL